MADGTTGAGGSRYKLPLKIYNDFRYGLCHDLAPDNRPENSIDTADNVVINNQGGFTRRLGESYLNSTSYGEQVEQLVEYTKNDGTDLLVGIIGTKLYKISQTDGTTTLIKDIGTTSAGFSYDNDTLLYCNGTYYNYYDGTVTGGIKVATPTATLSVIAYTVPAFSIVSSGSSEHKFKYKVTFVMPDDDNSDNEENGLEFRASTSTGWLESPNPSTSYPIAITNIPVDTYGVAVKRKLYRARKNEDNYHLVTTFTDNTTTTYTDTKSIATVEAGEVLDVASISGTYKICYTFVKSNSTNTIFYESDKSLTTTITLDSAATSYGFLITVPVSSDSTVTRRNIYRSLASGDTLKLVGTLYDNTTTIFYDSLEDEDNVGSTVVTDNAVDIVKKCTMLVRHPKSQRFFASGNTSNQAAVYYSEVGRPDYFKEESILYPTSGDGPVKGLAAFGDAIFAFYSNSVWMYRGTDPSSDTTWEKIPTGYGCVSQKSIILTPNSLSWLGYGGFYVMSPSVVGYGTGTVALEDNYLTKNLAKDKIVTDIAVFKTPGISAGVFDPIHNRVLWACTDSSGTRNNIIYCLQWETQAFTTWSGINANHLLAMRDGTIYAACNNRILKLNTGYNAADGTAIAAMVQSKPYHLGLLFNRKRFLRLFTEFKAPDAADNITISFKVYVDGEVVYETDQTSETSGFLWGTSVWGETRWGAPSIINTRSRLMENGHRISIYFTCNQKDIECIVYSYGIEYKVLKVKGDKI